MKHNSSMSHKEGGKLPMTLLASVALVSLAAGFTAGHFLLPSNIDPDSSADCSEKYPLLRDDLDCSSVNDDYERVNRIQDNLNSYIESQKMDGNVNRVSVFFRDLSSRRWAAVNKDELYAPGSMLKIVLAVAYFKLAEVEPGILTQEFTYSPTTESMNARETFKSKEQLVPGEKYSIDTLIERMIKDSDNEATMLLNDSIDKTFLKKVFLDLNIKLPETGGGEQNFITAERVSSLLRALYLASYLNVDNSQKLLNLMSHASFTQGISSGVPGGVLVAHKFGEREVIDIDTKKQLSAELHDCGIVYKENHPYILCVMTEGATYDHLANILSDISKLVYENE